MRTLRKYVSAESNNVAERCCGMGLPHSTLIITGLMGQPNVISCTNLNVTLPTQQQLMI